MIVEIMVTVTKVFAIAKTVLLERDVNLRLVQRIVQIRDSAIKDNAIVSLDMKV
jgi:hypothetical protein